MAMGVRFFVLREPCALEPPSGRGRSLRCWRLGSAALCCASAHHCTDALRWLSIMAAARLMLATGTTVDKYLLVPFFALQAPSSGISWIKGGHGALIASAIGLLMRLLHWFSPGELVRAVSTMLIAAVATTPFQFISLRESQGRAILSLVIAAYLAFQHFTGAGGLRRAFGREAIVATLCIVCMTVITLMLAF
ncbi:unnamed protein product [Urochloa decumbens]|uniref:Glycosyltransferase RgtA/B/C/D-like domain-containing protein n=1 Tax=Urochloa decumbens TaxID=240449 RepID=A0ABC8YVN2_9POAL